MVKYVAIFGSIVNEHSIYPVEVERESDSCVWVKGRRRNKFNNYERYFGTWQEAHDALVAHYTSKVDTAEAILRGRINELSRAQALTP